LLCVTAGVECNICKVALAVKVAANVRERARQARLRRNCKVLQQEGDVVVILLCD
jgi:hypothetical protein